MASPRLLYAALTLALLVAWTHGQLAARRPSRPNRPIPFSSPCPSFSYDAIYDLENNVITGNENVVLIEPLSGNGCNTTGVLKLVLASAATDSNRRRVLLDFFFTNPNKWVFNLGDSSTNNGYAGDSGNQEWDAEVQGVDTAFTGYLSDKGGSEQAFHILNLFENRLSLIVGDGHTIWIPNDNNNFNYYYNPNFFSLNGQTDSTGPVNYDLYLGLNRVIASAGRFGSGLCKVGIKFLKEH